MDGAAAALKKRKPHRVPLAPRTIELIAPLFDGTAPDDLLFPGAAAGKPLSGCRAGKAADARRDAPCIPAHLRTWAAEQTNHPREVIKQALAQRLGNAVEQADQRGDLFEERRALMADWAEFFLSGSGA